MAKKYLLYNPFAGDGDCKSKVEVLDVTYDETSIVDVCKINDYRKFFLEIEEDADIILCGGDGTLNHFVNDTRGIDIRNKVYYYPVGNGNDFARDLGYEKDADPTFCINQYMTNLPSVTINGKTQLFLNNVGFGIDGYCCEVGDKLRDKNNGDNKHKPINYTSIAIKGLLFHYKPRNATVVVDGKKYTYKKVWLAPTMNGRYYGGGMMATPKQNRSGNSHTVSVMVFHSTGKLRTLFIFPSIFKGKHIKHKKKVSILTGTDIQVTFDRPTPLQIDGETVLGVTEYTVCAHGEKEQQQEFS